MINKIAIIELDYHVECLNTLCKVFSFSNIEIKIITKKSIELEINSSGDYNKYKWITFSEGESMSKFIYKNLHEINSCDIILFNTLASNFRIFSKINFKVPTVLRIHNSNSYLNPLSNLKFKITPYFLFKDISHIVRLTVLKLDWYYRRKCINKMSYLNFNSPEIEEYARNKSMLKHYKTCLSIPTTCSNLDIPVKLPERNNYFFTVNGTIESKRRDYDFLLKSFQNLIPRLQTNVFLTFAGRPKGTYAKNIIKKFKKLENKHFTFRFFKKRIPQSEFDNLMLQTDCIIAPINIKTKYTIYKEEYGKTKFSGSVGDIIHYRKIGIVPSEYKLNKHQKKYIYQYNSNKDLSDILFNIISNKPIINEDYFQSSYPVNIYNNILNTFNKLEI